MKSSKIKPGEVIPNISKIIREARERQGLSGDGHSYCFDQMNLATIKKAMERCLLKGDYCGGIACR
jgi:predicted transcriptional regulator of viral defense system